jgi:hypothetical protein
LRQTFLSPLKSFKNLNNFPKALFSAKLTPIGYFLAVNPKNAGTCQHIRKKGRGKITFDITMWTKGVKT